MSIPKNSNLSPYYYENSEGRQPDSTLAQYNNNPGNIMYYQIDFDSGEIQMDKDGNPRVSDYAQNLIDQGFEIEPGAANDHGVFIKFKDNADGVRAKSMWWNTVKDWKTYKGLTLDEALLKYSGGGYDSKNYYKNGEATGSSPMAEFNFDGSKLLSDYSSSELDSISVSQLKTEDSKNYNYLVNEGFISIDPDTSRGIFNMQQPEVIQDTVEGISSEDPTMEQQAAEIERVKQREFQTEQVDTIPIQNVPKGKIDDNIITDVGSSDDIAIEQEADEDKEIKEVVLPEVDIVIDQNTGENITDKKTTDIVSSKETEEQETEIFTPDPQEKYIDSPMGVDKIDIPKLLDPDPEILKSVDDEIKNL